MEIAYDVVNLDCLYLSEAQSRRKILREWGFFHEKKRYLAVYLAKYCDSTRDGICGDWLGEAMIDNARVACPGSESC